MTRMASRKARERSRALRYVRLPTFGDRLTGNWGVARLFVRQRRFTMHFKSLAAALCLAGAAVAAGNQGSNPQPKTGGTENDPYIQLELKNFDGAAGAEAVLACLNQLPWASRTAVLPRYPGAIARDRLHPRATAVVTVGERQWADLADLADRLRGAGYTVSAIHLTRFGTVRI